MAARSVIATFNNQTSATLTLNTGATQILHGEWDTQPPQTIPPRSSASWASESAGLMTGTEVRVVYTSPGGEVVTSYDNPFSGSNGANITYPDRYLGVAQISDGNDAVATYTLTSH